MLQQKTDLASLLAAGATIMVATVWLMTVTVVDLATESTVRTIDGLAAIIIDGVRKFQQRHL